MATIWTTTKVKMATVIMLTLQTRTGLYGNEDGVVRAWIRNLNVPTTVVARATQEQNICKT